MRRYLPYLAPLMLVLMLVVACEGGIVNLSGDLVSRAAFESGCDYVDADTARIWVTAADAGWADVHYRVNGGGQLNVRMNRDGTYFWYDVNGLSEGAVIDYWFTIGFNAGAQDTGWYSYTHTAGGSSPTPTPAGSTTFVIEAEDYAAMSGVQTESCAEGGLNVGWIDAGDWMAYASRSFEGGEYLVEYRVASLNGGGQLSADLNAGSIVLGSVSIPSTGGWQNWTTVSHTVTIPAGNHAFGIYAVSGGWNINWIRFTYLGSGGSTPTPTPTPPPSGDWVLIWSDEFDGSSLNSAYWTPEIGGHGWGNNELEYYTDRPENIQVSGGYLQIIARRESYGGMNYTSARLKTENKVYHTYGKIEARIRLSRLGMGLWPAFWMLGNNFSQVSWPACGEIDIMEHINTEDVVYGTIHWDAGGYASYGGNISPVDVTQWHVYSIEWDASSIKWFVDGVQYHEANIANSINSTEEFHRPFFILLNVAIGGNWPGFTVDDSMFPVTMYVDWVRWYQR